MSLLWSILAALFEISGCYAVWIWLRLGRSPWWGLAGTVALLLFAAALTRIDSPSAGRAFAAYGGIYIVCSLVWLALVERQPPAPSDIVGALVSVLGACIILLGARGS